MTGETDGRLATIEANLTNHIKADEAQSKRLEENGIEIKAMIRDLANDLKQSVQRLHTVREEDADKVRLATSEIIESSNDKLAEVTELARSAHQRIDGQKIWLLSNVVGAAVMFIVAVGWLYDRFIVVHPR